MMMFEATQLFLAVDHSDKLTPPLKWAGGKRWLVPHLKKLYLAHRERRLVEPFVGGLSVALALSPNRALLGDSNVHLINFYHWLQKGLKIRQRFKNDKIYFYRQRSKFNRLIVNAQADSEEAAGIFYYLNRTGYNGLCRFNSQGLYNVPFGKYATISYQDDFSPYVEALKNWKFKASDFEKLKVKPNDFIYADPPYDVEFTRYSKLDFTFEDQKRLAHWLSRHPGPVVTSNQATSRMCELYAELGFKLLKLSAPRMISCTGDRSRVEEFLALKNI